MPVIPRTIYYCWFGRNPYPAYMERYKYSWKKYMPDHEIIEINEDNYDIGKNRYIRKAYEQKKYAFVSDYARFDILYQNGGLYLDTDVELLKSLQPIIEKGPYMGIQNPYDEKIKPQVNAGLGMAAYRGMPVLKEILTLYEEMEFEFGGGKNLTVVEHVTEILEKHGLKNSDGIQYVAGFYIYPVEYFSPTAFLKKSKTYFTENTYSIHHYEASWLSKKWRRKRAAAEFIQGLVGYKLYDRLLEIKHGNIIGKK